jgi:MoxR-like ATPase
MSTQDVAKSFQEKMSQLVFGQEQLIEDLTICLLCRGHGLLTGLPGLAKTRLVEMASYLLNQTPKRIQFTPDLTPFDIIGGEALKQDPQTRNSILEFMKGPLFHPFIIADEINRASPRTQSALLEAMQERKVTVSGITYPLPRPFLVFATQNPLEQEGTFPLPEAQLDRFLMEFIVTYPDSSVETKILDLASGLQDWEETTPEPLAEPEKLWDAKEELNKIVVEDDLKQAIVRFVDQTRPHRSELSLIKDYVAYGASPRASQSLFLTMKARALLQGRTKADFDDLLVMSSSVLRHRIGLNLKARLDQFSLNDLLETLQKEVSF